MSDFDEILTEEDLNILTLTDEDGTEMQFEFLDLIEYEGQEYAVLLPIIDTDEEDDGMVVILAVNEIDEETEEYVSVEDEAVLNAVFDIFKEKFKDEFNFTDGE